MKKYDSIIIGAGPGGIRAAELLGRSGQRVCLVEKAFDRLGGTCLNEGCIPVKSLLYSAHEYRRAINYCSEDGKAPWSPDLELFSSRAVKKIELLRRGIMSQLAAAGVEIVYGQASFLDSTTVEIKEEDEVLFRLKAKTIVIAVGAEPAPFPGIIPDGEYIHTSDTLLRTGLELRDIVIVGGGYIGCEYASFFKDLGVSVTLLEGEKNLLPGEDGDISRQLSRELKKGGVRIIVASQVKNISLDPTREQVDITIAGRETLSASRILLALGRVPCLDSLGLERVGLKTESGLVEVDEVMQTKIKGIYAVGDVVGAPMLAHVATREGETAAHFILGRSMEPIRYDLVPRVVFSQPQVGAIGMTEQQASESGLEIEIYKRHFKANGQAVVTDQAQGFAKIIYERASGRILGAGIIGPQAVELIQLLSFPLRAGSTFPEFQRCIFAHPTLSEIWGR